MNHQALSSFIWSVADLLRDTTSSLIMARLFCPSRCCVVWLRPRANQGQGACGIRCEKKAKLNPDRFLLRASGQSFYNTSDMDLRKLMGDQDHISQNLVAYIQGFSPQRATLRAVQHRRTALKTNEGITMSAQVRGDGRQQMRLAVHFHPTGHHVAAWLHPDPKSMPEATLYITWTWRKTAERGKFDLIFLVDSLAIREGDLRAKGRLRQYMAYFEPLTLFSAMSSVTSRVGLVATGSTSFTEPFNLARQFASLDHLSGGRAGWNVVTTGNAASSRILDAMSISSTMSVTSAQTNLSKSSGGFGTVGMTTRLSSIVPADATLSSRKNAPAGSQRALPFRERAV